VIVREQYLVIIARRIVENCARGRGLLCRALQRHAIEAGWEGGEPQCFVRRCARRLGAAAPVSRVFCAKLIYSAHHMRLAGDLFEPG
jgi:hypothetical protein